MPKLLIVIARLNVGGTAQYIGELAKALPHKGYEVLIATGHVQGREIEDDVVKVLPIIRIKNLGRKISLFNDLRARSAIKDVIAQFKPDIIYSHTFKAGALVRSMRVKVPIVHGFHGHLLDEPELAGFKVKIVVALERFFAKRTKVIVTVGKRVAEELLLQRVGSREKYRSIAPGVHPLKLEDSKRARKSLGLEREKRPIVAWLARVVPVKAPERVLEIAKALPEARFILAGGGDLLEKVKNSAPENLTVLGWQEARKVWAVADIALSTSENEGMPVALIEAQLAGLPVVALDVGSISEVISNGETGYVLENFDNEYIERVRELVADPKLRKSMGRKAKLRSNELFQVERLISDHLGLFKSLL